MESCRQHSTVLLKAPINLFLRARSKMFDHHVKLHEAHAPDDTEDQLASENSRCRCKLNAVATHNEENRTRAVTCVGSSEVCGDLRCSHGLDECQDVSIWIPDIELYAIRHVTQLNDESDAGNSKSVRKFLSVVNANVNVNLLLALKSGLVTHGWRRTLFI